jgi:hypothetical protein
VLDEVISNGNSGALKVGSASLKNIHQLAFPTCPRKSQDQEIPKTITMAGYEFPSWPHLEFSLGTQLLAD